MSLTSVETADIVAKHKRSEHDTGSTEVQVSLLTTRIRSLTEHLKIHKKDVHTRRGLQMMVSRRRKLLRYLKNTTVARYRDLIKVLSLRDTY